jgi:hypothetical protein
MGEEGQVNSNRLKPTGMTIGSSTNVPGEGAEVKDDVVDAVGSLAFA